MTRRTARGNLTQRPRATGGNRAAIGMLKSSLHGHANKLMATNPPQINSRPYNTVVVSKTFLGTSVSALNQEISIATVIEALEDQLGISGINIRVKLHRADFWAIPSAGAASITALNAIPEVVARYYSLVPSVGESSGSGVGAIAFKTTLKELEDIGLPGQTSAVVSYSWPRDQSDLPLGKPEGGSNVAPQPVCTVFAPVNVDITARIHLHWSTIGQPDEVPARFRAHGTPPVGKQDTMVAPGTVSECR